jgi:hypothetical protein
MPSHKAKSRPRVADLSALLEAHSKAGIDLIVVEGLAAVAQGAPITTMDMDIAHRQTYSFRSGSLTASILSGCQRGLSSLSTKRALTPST